jgi:hypothetical protein
MKIILIILLLIFSVQVFSQNDFVVLKKKGITIERYFKGAPIHVYSNENFLYEGFVSKCFNDTIRIHLGYIGLVAKGFGTTIDTIFTGYANIAVKNIVLIPKKRTTIADIGNLAFKIGIIAGGIIGVSQIQIEPPTIYLAQFASAAVLNFVAGVVKPFRHNKLTGYYLGKKYTLEYINLTTSK